MEKCKTFETHPIFHQITDKELELFNGGKSSLRSDIKFVNQVNTKSPTSEISEIVANWQDPETPPIITKRFNCNKSANKKNRASYHKSHNRNRVSCL